MAATQHKPMQELLTAGHRPVSTPEPHRKRRRRSPMHFLHCRIRHRPCIATLSAATSLHSSCICTSNAAIFPALSLPMRPRARIGSASVCIVRSVGYSLDSPLREHDIKRSGPPGARPGAKRIPHSQAPGVPTDNSCGRTTLMYGDQMTPACHHIGCYSRLHLDISSDWTPPYFLCSSGNYE